MEPLNETLKKSIDRRKFLKVSGVSGTALVLGFSLPGFGGEEQTDSILRKIDPSKVLSVEVNPFIIIENTGKITLMATKPDMGQGTYQTMPLLIAEELEVDINQIHIAKAVTEKKYGDQSVGGSNSVKGMWLPLRKAGAAAREMLVKAAAQSWKTDESDCYAEKGKVIHRPTKRSLTYGELVETASKFEVPKEPKLKEPKDFKLIGKAIHRADVPLKISGKAGFGMDVEVPGMLYASIERSPVFYGKVVSFDDTEARKIKGVRHVLNAERKLNKNIFSGVAVVADSYYAALQGRRALKITWDNQGNDQKISTEAIYNEYRELAKTEGLTDTNVGDFSAAFTSAAKQLEAQYELPYVAHAPMEPQNATVSVKGDQCEVWAPTQVPDWALGEIATYLQIPPENIRLNVTFLGGGFGRRLFFDSIMEAAYLSKQLQAPIKVVWTREDDTTQGPFRPGTLSVLKGALDANGKLVAFQHKIVSPSIDYDNFPGYDKNKPNESVMEGVSKNAYEIPNFRTNHVFVENILPLGWWRAVYSSTTTFAHESFIDEMAVAAGKDPLQFRLDMLGKSPKIQRVLSLLAEKSGWNKPLPKGWGKGVAVWEFFAGLCGHVVLVSKTEGKPLKIEKVISVIDCGIAVNPDNVKAQTEGNVVMALTAALKDAITFEGGKAVQKNFDAYRMLRINETPLVEVHIVPSEESPIGVGEPGMPPLAPALCNAIFHATGKRIRNLPFDLESV